MLTSDFPFTNHATAANNAAMKVYIRNFAYAALFFTLLSVIKIVPLISNAELGESSEELGKVPNPRFKRSILDLDSSSSMESKNFVSAKSSEIEMDEKADVFDSIREGPAVDLGTRSPAKLGKDLFISVKTTFKFHSSRLKDIFDTWFRLAPEKIFFFTDRSDQNLNRDTGGHLINTNCSSSHSRQALCCKMSVELDFFLASGKSWFCHFDDDNYVNVPELMRLLSMYDPKKDWYIGRPSTRGPIQIIDRLDQSPQTISFWFATGGAGFCISRSLALKMAPYASKKKFISLGEQIRLPDDVTMGYLIEHLLGKRLTVVNRFHSHLESMTLIPLDTLHEQVSLSAGSYNSERNVVSIDGPFSPSEDPNKFRSIHCFLFPNAHVCRNKALQQ